MREVRKDDKGVTPIIATILLIGITVVLAATLISILSGFTNSTHLENVNSSISLSGPMEHGNTSIQYDLNITSASESPPLSQIIVEIFDGSSLVFNGPIVQGGSGNVSFSFSPSYPDFSAGNVISITLSGENDHITTIDLIYASTEFATVSPY